MEAEIQILKVFYTIKGSFGTVHLYAKHIGFCIPELKLHNRHCHSVEQSSEHRQSGY